MNKTAIAFAILFPSFAFAQANVTTLPAPTTTTGNNASSTITVTNTFQQVFAATTPSAPRRGCTIQNNGTHNMYVEEGVATGSATTGNSAIVTPGSPWYCGVNGLALYGAVQITGTSGDAFYAASY